MQKHHIINVFNHQEKLGIGVKNVELFVNELARQIPEQEKWKDIEIKAYKSPTELPDPQDLVLDKTSIFNDLVKPQVYALLRKRKKCLRNILLLSIIQ